MITMMGCPCRGITRTFCRSASSPYSRFRTRSRFRRLLIPRMFKNSLIISDMPCGGLHLGWHHQLDLVNIILLMVGTLQKKGFLSPYRAPRYHLKEFNGIRPATYKELFNLRHSSLCTTVERAFGSLKNHFTIMKCDPYFPLETQVDIVLACCILHNWILIEGSDELIISEDDCASRGYIRRYFGESLDDSNEWFQKRD